MYTKQIPFKDFFDKPKNATVHFNLTETEVFKLLREFQLVFNWRESMAGQELRELDTGEVIEFYTAFEEILLSAYGTPSADGLYFDKTDRYKFESSALFAATMVMFVTEPEETGKLIDGIMPKGLEDMVKKADANLAELAKKEGTSTDVQRQIAELQAKLAQQEAENTVASRPAGPTGVVPPQQ